MPQTLNNQELTTSSNKDPKIQDRIIISNLQAFTKLGSYDAERILGQTVNINLELELDLQKPGKSNMLQDTINYVDVSIMIREFAISREFYLVENLALEIVELLLNKFDKLEGVLIEVNKTIVNAEQFSGNPAVRIYRQRS